MKQLISHLWSVTYGMKFKTAVLLFVILTILVIIDSRVGLKPYVLTYFGTVGVFIGQVLGVYYVITLCRIIGEYIKDYCSRFNDGE